MAAADPHNDNHQCDRPERRQRRQLLLGLTLASVMVIIGEVCAILGEKAASFSTESGL